MYGIITGHVVRESFIFETLRLTLFYAGFVACDLGFQPRIESVPGSPKYHSVVVFVRMEVEAGQNCQKAYLTPLS